MNTRMPQETSDLLTYASEQTGQTKTAIVVDAIHWYCGRVAKGDRNISLRRAGILSAVGENIEDGMAANVAALKDLTAIIEKFQATQK